MEDLLKLTDENYFSKEADNQYMSVSQFKSFFPQYGGCEAKAMAKLKGLYKEEENTALLVGSYFHSHFEGSLNKFKQDHPEIFTQKGELKAQYKLANQMINCLETDESFKKIYIGEKEKLFTFELFGIPWKIKVDLLNINDGYFIDLKTTQNFESKWNKEIGRKTTFVENWGYIIQAAIYKKGIEIANNISDVEAFIIATTKQDPPDKIILGFKQEDYECGLREVEENIKHILEVKNGLTEPEACGHCDYCRTVKKLDKVVHWSELLA